MTVIVIFYCVFGRLLLSEGIMLKLYSINLKLLVLESLQVVSKMRAKFFRCCSPLYNLLNANCYKQTLNITVILH